MKGRPWRVPQVTLHSKSPSNDLLPTVGASLLGLWQPVVAAAADGVTIEAVHDPGFLDHLLEANETLQVGHLPFTGIKPPQSPEILLCRAHRNEWLGILALLTALNLASCQSSQLAPSS